MEFILGLALGGLAGGLLVYAATMSWCRELERDNAKLKAALEEATYRNAFNEPKKIRTMWD